MRILAANENWIRVPTQDLAGADFRRNTLVVGISRRGFSSFTARSTYIQAERETSWSSDSKIYFEASIPEFVCEDPRACQADFNALGARGEQETLTAQGVITRPWNSARVEQPTIEAYLFGGRRSRLNEIEWVTITSSLNQEAKLVRVSRVAGAVDTNMINRRRDGNSSETRAIVFAPVNPGEFMSQFPFGIRAGELIELHRFVPSETIFLNNIEIEASSTPGTVNIQFDSTDPNPSFNLRRWDVYRTFEDYRVNTPVLPTPTSKLEIRGISLSIANARALFAAPARFRSQLAVPEGTAVAIDERGYIVPARTNDQAVGIAHMGAVVTTGQAAVRPSPETRAAYQRLVDSLDRNSTLFPGGRRSGGPRMENLWL